MMSMNHPEIYRVDANTGQVLPTIRTPYTGISDLLFAGGAVWVSYKPGGVARYSTDGQFLGFLTTGETHADLWRSDDRVNALRSGAIFTSYFLDGTYAGTGSLGVGTGLYSEVSVVRSGSTTWVADGSLDIYRVTPHGLEFSDAQGSETDLVAIPSPGVGAFGLAAGLMALAPTRRQATNL
ncbi:MAG: hypothetical protein JNK53_03380 [Phycisphaerae bacterium]|nr:hypothetical protein [Phycisphaerae bacterium]